MGRMAARMEMAGEMGRESEELLKWTTLRMEMVSRSET